MKKVEIKTKNDLINLIKNIGKWVKEDPVRIGFPFGFTEAEIWKSARNGRIFVTLLDPENRFINIPWKYFREYLERNIKK